MFPAPGAGLFTARDASSADLAAGIRSGRIEEVRRLLQSGARASSVHLYNAYTELIVDWSSDRYSIAHMLHQHRASLGSSFKPFHDPEVLDHAIRNNNEAVVKLLIQRGADANAEGNHWVPLQSALWHGNQSIVRTLLNAGASVDERAPSFDEFIDDEMTPLLYAASEDLAMSVRLLLQHGASVNEVDEDGETALMHAVRAYAQDLECITLLIDAGSPIDAQSCRGHTALMIAASGGSVETVSLLLERGASVNIVNRHNWTALMFAAMYGSADIMKILMDAGSPIDVVSVSGETALMSLAGRKPDEKFACDPKRLRETIKLFLERGASIDQVNSQNLTVLMIGAYNGNDQIVRVLLELGASLDYRAETGDTALRLAQRAGHDKVISLLVQYSASAANAPVHDEMNTPSSSEDVISLFDAATIGDDAAALRLLQVHTLIDKQTPTGETPLMRAVWNRQVQIVRRLIDHGANLEIMDDDKWSALLIAAHVGDSDITRLLTEAGASLDTLGNGNNSALMRAVSKGHEGVVKVLIEKGARIDLEQPRLHLFRSGWTFGTDLSLTNPDKQKEGWTALMYAATSGFEGIVKILIESGAAVNLRVISENDTPLMCAARNGHDEIVRTLIAHGAHVNAVNEANDTALEWALRNCHQKAVRILIDKGAKIDGRNEKSVLSCAASYGCKEIVAMLLHRGGAINECDGNGKTLLMHAAEGGHDDCVRLLLDAGASVNCRSRNKWNALMFAACGGHNGCLLKLLESGADVNAQTEDGYTVLIIASQKGKTTAVKCLLSRGAATEIVCSDLKHRTALIVAASEGYDPIVRLLIQAKSAIDAKGSDGKCALWLATVRRHEDVIKTLLEGGACVNSVDIKGHTPLMIAAEENYQEGVRILLNAGADIDAVDNEESTAIMLAAMKGQHKIVGLLRGKNASLETRNKDGWSVFMLAADFGDNAVMRELLVEPSVLNNAVAYLQAGITEKMDQQALPIQVQEPTIMRTDLLELCSGLLGASDMWQHVSSRLLVVERQLKSMTKIAQRRPMRSFMPILEQMLYFLNKYSGKPTVIHLLSHEQIVETCDRIHRQLDEFVRENGIFVNTCIHSDWKTQFNENVKAYQLGIGNRMNMDHQSLFHELQSSEAQEEALMLLLFECDTRASKYTEEEMNMMHSVFRHVSSFSKLGIPSVPEWFVPPQDVNFDGVFASGAFGSVHLGQWNGAEVAVKSAFLLDAQSRTMFMNEVDIWYKLRHPNIVQLFKACHVGNPFFVCEYAENGTLSDFLFKKSDPAKTWEKLFEAARGLQYLHEEHKVVHGDLKCNNILVGGTRSSEDGPAKLTDFGLSFKTSDCLDPIADEVGAIQWKAPEVIEGRTRGSLASDAYSFGMCILEAVKGNLPWGNFPDVTVKYTLLKAKQLPNRPKEVNDAQWELISRMCAWESSDRPAMKEVVKTLQKMAQDHASEV